uniref:hypothetical protein n=1 Tax=Vaginimicrobium propionicum TaxID=1871034 RepID=UPI000971252B|nr:hypothetical protein [Vaginimicrobium propionicum]
MKIDPNSVIWAMLFLVIAGLSVWIASGAGLSVETFAIFLSVIFIGLGALGLILVRANSTRKEK